MADQQLHGPFNTSYCSSTKQWGVIDWYGNLVANCGTADNARAVAAALNASTAVAVHL